VGYHIYLERNAKSFVERLVNDPQRLFKEAYAGYIVFLFDSISCSDAAIKEWFERHARSLDSMTGTDVAFAVFAQRFEAPLVTRGYRQKRKRSTTQPDLEIQGGEDPHMIEPLLGHGLEQCELGGKESISVCVANRAVYAFARELGVTQWLPCMVAIDGFPDPLVPWVCVPLHDVDLEQIFVSLRRAVGLLQSHPKREQYQQLLNEMSSAADRSASLNRRLNALSTTQPCSLRTPAVSEVEALRKALRKGRPDLVHKTVAKLGVLHPNPHFLEQFLERLPPKYIALARAVQGLNNFLTAPWPWSDAQCNEFAVFFEEFLRPHLSERYPVRAIPRKDLVTLHKSFDRLRNQHVDCIMQSLPSLEEWRRYALARRSRAMQRKLEWIRAQIAELDLSMYRSGREVLSFSERPSWCNLLREVLGTTQIVNAPGAENTPQGAGGQSRALDWIDPHDVLPLMRRRDFFGLFHRLAQAIENFGRSVLYRPPTAFASYASDDRSAVLQRLQGMRAFQPDLDVFLDFHSLNPGDRWRDRLSEEILRRDRFFLFWSQSASRSEYVEAEWRTALHYAKPITPVPLVSPESLPPPSELQCLHFNDAYLAYLDNQLLSPKGTAQAQQTDGARLR
jgi:hypothetical protein